MSVRYNYNEKIQQIDYLALSAMLRARQMKMPDRDKMDRMLAANSFGDAAKILTDCGFEDMSSLDARGVDESLARRRSAIFEDVDGMSPDPRVVELFRLKYDYHNAKVIIKAEGAGVSGTHLFSDSGRVSFEKLSEAYAEEDYRFVPLELGKAMIEAKGVLARTGNPQLADFVLDEVYFKELAEIAQKTGWVFLIKYAKLLTDAANLRTAVRTVRMGRSQEFLNSALFEQGEISVARVAQAAMTGEEIVSVFAPTFLKDAAVLGAEAMKGGSMTRFELSCDNAISKFLNEAKLTAFGADALVEYLSLVETETTAVRMILSGKLAGIAPNAIKERLRDINA